MMNDTVGSLDTFPSLLIISATLKLWQHMNEEGVIDNQGFQ